METQNTFATILENESVTVSALLCAETLKITVKVNDETNEHFGQTFVTEITEQQRNEKLNDYFENLNEVLDFMQLQEKLIKINLQEKTITLYEMTKLKKERSFFTTELTIETTEEKIIEESDPSILQNRLSQISNRCLEKSEIENDQIKKYFEIIANELITLRKEKVDKNQQNEMKNEFKGLNEYLLIIQEQNKKIQNQIQQQNKQLQGRFTEFINNICELQKQVSLQNVKIETFETKINEKSEKIIENTEKLLLLQKNLCQQSERLNKEIDLYAEKLKIEINELFSKKSETVNLRLLNLEMKMSFLNDYVQIQKQKQERQKQKRITLMQKCKNQINSNDYDFDGKILIRANQSICYKIYTFFEQIVFGVQFVFHVKLMETSFNGVSIGVIDYEDYVLNNYKENNYVCYYSKGRLLPKDIKQGKVYKAGDFVTVSVNRKNKQIKWLVNNNFQVSQKADFLGNKNKKLYPFVELSEPGQIVQFTF